MWFKIPQNQSAMSPSGKENLNIGYLSLKSGGCKHPGSWDIMLLVYQVISQNNVLKGLCDLIGGSSSWWVTSLPDLVDISTVLEEIR